MFPKYVVLSRKEIKFIKKIVTEEAHLSLSIISVRKRAILAPCFK